MTVDWTLTPPPTSEISNMPAHRAIARVCDLETTGKDPANAEVVEVACCDVAEREGGLCVPRSSAAHSLVRPAMKIPPSASAVHHVTDDDVADAPTWADAWHILVDDGLRDEMVFAAHVASFERNWLDPLIKARWICTWKCALRQWPGLESYSLQSLRYELRLQVEWGRADPPHRALPDAYVCGLLLIELLRHQAVETLIAWSDEPPVFTTFDFGQFKGKPLTAAGTGYLDWLANKEHTLGDDWRWNATREIQRRKDERESVAAAVRSEFVDRAKIALAAAATVRDLENWYVRQADTMAEHGIIAMTDEYEQIIRACANRKAELLSSGEPDFGKATRS